MSDRTVIARKKSMSDPTKIPKEEEVDLKDQLLLECYTLLQDLQDRRLSKQTHQTIKGLLPQLEVALSFITLH